MMFATQNPVALLTLIIMNIKTRIATECDNLICGILRVAGYSPTLYNTTSQTNQKTMTTYQANVLSPDVEYNGWTNYETWNVGLWLGLSLIHI